MSFLSSRSKVIVEKDYTEQLIFSDKVPDSIKNKCCMIIIGVLFSLFTTNVVHAMLNAQVMEKFF